MKNLALLSLLYGIPLYNRNTYPEIDDKIINPSQSEKTKQFYLKKQKKNETEKRKE